MDINRLHWMGIALIVCVKICSCQVLAFQCRILFSYVGCSNNVAKEQCLEEWKLSSVTREHSSESSSLDLDEFTCRCAEKAEKQRYKQIAIFQTPQDKIACYGVRFGGSRTLMVAYTAVNNQLQDNCFNANPSGYQRHNMIGNGEYSAVYSVTSSIVTLPRQTTTTVKTMLLTTTTRKPFVLPPFVLPPFIESE